jgi:hypothetical protein
MHQLDVGPVEGPLCEFVRASFAAIGNSPSTPIDPGVAEHIHIELGRLNGVLAAADRLDNRVLLVRLMSASGPAFHEARRWISERITSL